STLFPYTTLFRAQRGARYGLRLAFVFVDDFLPAVHLMQPAFCGIAFAFEIAKAHLVDIGARDAAEIGEELPADLFPQRAIRIGREDGADLAILDLLHHEEGAIEDFASLFQRDGLRHGKAEGMERAIGAKFRGTVGFDQAGRLVAAQDEAAFDFGAVAIVAGTEAIGFAACTPRDARETRNFQIGNAHHIGEIGFQPFAQIVAHGAGSRMSLKPDGACGPMTSCSRTPAPTRSLPSGPESLAVTKACTCRKRRSFSLTVARS